MLEYLFKHKIFMQNQILFLSLSATQVNNKEMKMITWSCIFYFSTADEYSYFPEQRIFSCLA